MAERKCAVPGSNYTIVIKEDGERARVERDGCEWLSAPDAGCCQMLVAVADALDKLRSLSALAERMEQVAAASDHTAATGGSFSCELRAEAAAYRNAASQLRAALSRCGVA